MGETVCWIAATIEENGKYYSYGIPVKNTMNLLSTLAAHKNLIIAHPCKTKKECVTLVNNWNIQYITNGTYFFEGGPKF